MTFPAEPEIKSFETGNDLCLAVVELAIDRIRTGLATNGVFHLALTGGATGTLIAEHLVAIWNQTPAEFAGLHIWWGDERFLSEMSEARNARVVIQYLRSNGSIDVHEAPSSNSTINLDTAARMYRADVAGIAMDLTLLGVGPDGHVASLFPGCFSRFAEASTGAGDVFHGQNQYISGGLAVGNGREQTTCRHRNLCPR
jgi:6-phosphogluconolactonase